jgi:diaminohydroxyphosphoribosylaminopyrimidine deaminase/5-amino-6-(5-phosphoribosylamino)uracil reductase
MTQQSTDELLMARALELARQGIGLASPNPYVGAVVARGEEVVGEGTHLYAGRKHAEVLALENAGERARGATLYLNLEPCCHFGRTGPCTETVIAAGVRRVVAAMADPNPLVAGQGFMRLRSAGIEVATGIGEAEARKLNEAFAVWIRTRRPLVTLKAALTLDGQIALSRPDSGGSATWITGDTARAHVQDLRHQADAILVGVGTALADDPLLTDRTGKPRRRPLLRVILDSHLRLSPESHLVRSAQDDLLVLCASPDPLRQKELERRGVRVEVVAHPISGVVDLGQAITRLGELQLTSLLVEGGSAVHGTLLRERLADKVFLYYAPRLFGNGGVPLATGTGFGRAEDAPHVRHLAWHRLGEDFGVEGYLKDPYGESG